MKQLKTLLTIALCGLCMLANSQGLPCNNEFFVKHYKLGKANYDKHNYAAALSDLDIAGQICPTCQDCKTMLADCKAKIKAAQQKVDRIAEAKAAQKEQDRLAKEEVDRVAKADREEKDRLAKEEADKIAKVDREEKERLAKENADLKRKLAEAQNPAPPVPRGGATKRFMDLPFADMVYVEGGTFMMGSNEGDADAYDSEMVNGKKHSVTVSSFYIGKYEVTQAQWRAVMGTDPPELYNKNCNNCPVDRVSWDDVQGFLKKLNAQTGKNYRLPTEAEWEYAARGGSRWQDGYIYSGSNKINEVAWYDDGNYKGSNYGTAGTTHRVGIKAANQLGIYDMSGNVLEWCADWYASDWYAQVGANPQNTDYGNKSLRVLRGGSWFLNPQDSRVANRYYSSPSLRSNSLGFRLVSPQ